MKAWTSIANGLTAVLCAIAAGSVTAQGLPSASPPESSNAPLPTWQTSGNVRYLCGGVGTGEQIAVRNASPRDLLLTFTARTGQYLADVEVEILRRGRTVLEANCAGPMMVLDLPGPGRYEVRAKAAGLERRQFIDIPAAGSRSAVLRWPIDPDGAT